MISSDDIQKLAIMTMIVAIAICVIVLKAHGSEPWTLYVYEQKDDLSIQFRLYPQRDIQSCVDAFDALIDQRRKLIAARCVHINASMPSFILREENPDTEFTVFDRWHR